MVIHGARLDAGLRASAAAAVALRAAGGPPRVRSHYRFALLLIHVILNSLRESAPLLQNRFQKDRIQKRPKFLSSFSEFGFQDSQDGTNSGATLGSKEPILEVPSHRCAA